MRTLRLDASPARSHGDRPRTPQRTRDRSPCLSSCLAPRLSISRCSLPSRLCAHRPSRPVALQLLRYRRPSLARSLLAKRTISHIASERRLQPLLLIFAHSRAEPPPGLFPSANPHPSIFNSPRPRPQLARLTSPGAPVPRPYYPTPPPIQLSALPRPGVPSHTQWQTAPVGELELFAHVAARPPVHPSIHLSTESPSARPCERTAPRQFSRLGRSGVSPPASSSSYSRSSRVPARAHLRHRHHRVLFLFITSPSARRPLVRPWVPLGSPALELLIVTGMSPATQTLLHRSLPLAAHNHTSWGLRGVMKSGC